MHLRCFKIGPDRVIAADEADARKVIEEAYGDGEVGTDLPCEPVPDERPILIVLDDAPEANTCDCLEWAHEASDDITAHYCRNGHRKGCAVGCPELPAAEWVLRNGRGLLCSTEL